MAAPKVSSQLSDELLKSASKRISDRPGLTESDLRRATSDLYFSLFHRVCGTLVEHLTPDPENRAEVETWKRLYRQPDHKTLEKQCRDGRIAEFPQQIRLFANQLVEFKTKREDADYDPLATFDIRQVRTDVEIVASAIQQYDSCELARRQHFAFFVTLRR